MTRKSVLLCLVVFCAATLSGCGAMHAPKSSSSRSLNEIIEPIKDSRQAVQKKSLSPPVSVAIVMIPSNQPDYPKTSLRLAADKLKQQLLGNPKYISTVDIVPYIDFKSKISLEQIREIYDADIAILLSYQQDQRRNQSGIAGLMDMTIAGVFLVPGVEITTTSVIDGMVIHILSNAIIFRTSVTDERTSLSTTYAQEGNIQEESIKSMLAATTDFGNSLTKTLSNFENYDFSQAVSLSVLTDKKSIDAARGRPANDYWAKVDYYKSTGGGAVGIVPLLISVVVCCSVWRRK